MTVIPRAANDEVPPLTGPIPIETAERAVEIYRGKYGDARQAVTLCKPTLPIDDLADNVEHFFVRRELNRLAAAVRRERAARSEIEQLGFSIRPLPAWVDEALSGARENACGND